MSIFVRCENRSVDVSTNGLRTVGDFREAVSKAFGFPIKFVSELDVDDKTELINIKLSSMSTIIAVPKDEESPVKPVVQPTPSPQPVSAQSSWNKTRQFYFTVFIKEQVVEIDLTGDDVLADLRQEVAKRFNVKPDQVELSSENSILKVDHIQLGSLFQDPFPIILAQLLKEEVQEKIRVWDIDVVQETSYGLSETAHSFKVTHQTLVSDLINRLSQVYKVESSKITLLFKGTELARNETVMGDKAVPTSYDRTITLRARVN